MKTASFFRLSCGFLLSAASLLCAAQTYKITDLGTISGDDYSVARALNATGQVTGASGKSNSNLADIFLYSNGKMTNLGNLGGNTGIGNGINASGQIAGYSTIANGTYRAFLASNGTLTDIGDLGGGSAVAYDINDSGQVVGSAVTSHGANHPFLYSNGQMTDLGTLGSPDNVDWWNSAQSVNKKGVVTGTSYDADGNFFGFVWKKGKMSKIGTLGGAWSEAYAVNNNGQVTGLAYTKDGSTHAFLMSPKGKLKDLGFIGDKTSISWGFAINDAGIVVGQFTVNGTYHAFVYNGTKMKDLNTLIPRHKGWELLDAQGINNVGQIVGLGMHNGLEHAYLLTPR